MRISFLKLILVHGLLLIQIFEPVPAQTSVSQEVKMSFENNLYSEIKGFKTDSLALEYNKIKQHYTSGIRGAALDLKSSGGIGNTIQVPVEFPDMSFFTVQVWVKSSIKQSSVILTNRVSEADSVLGWTISAQEDGAWRWTMSDGNTSFDYTPTAQRQTITDGEWHQLTFSINKISEKVYLYYDGLSVAIYHIGLISDIFLKLPVYIGSEGISSEQRYDGSIDELVISSERILGEKIERDYLSYTEVGKQKLQIPGDTLAVMAWNIWHGGREHGEQIGVQRVIDVIKKANPDIICMIETYGSGPIIADALGYYFYLRSSNLSIMSRYPFGDFIDIFQPFNCGGVYVDIGHGREVAIVDTWLHYLPDYRKAMREDSLSAEEIYANEGETRYAEISQILEELSPLIKNSKKIPIILAGDFNTPSHLDFTRKMAETHWDYIIEWPVTKELELSGFKDSFREIHPKPQENYGGTQPSEIFNSFHYRIDYIFYRGQMLKPISSMVIKNHPEKFPSDHNAVLTVFEVDK